MFGMIVLYVGLLLLFNDMRSAGVILTMAGTFIHLIEWAYAKYQIDDLQEKVENNSLTIKHMSDYIMGKRGES